MAYVPKKFRNALAYWQDWEALGDPLPELTSSLKESGANCGIAWGDEMEKFVNWATEQIIGKDRLRQIEAANS